MAKNDVTEDAPKTPLNEEDKTVATVVDVDTEKKPAVSEQASHSYCAKCNTLVYPVQADGVCPKCGEEGMNQVRVVAGAKGREVQPVQQPAAE